MGFVYMMTNQHHSVIYTGSTADIVERTLSHKKGVHPDAFTLKYKCFKLVWYEEEQDMRSALDREYPMKRWRREWKENLISSVNPEWKDLSEGWHDAFDLQ